MAAQAERLPWGKFYWDKWDREPTLKQCSLAAQGLWMRLLCTMALENGYLRINGKAPSLEAIALTVGRPAEEIKPLLLELQEHGVYSRTATGVIYSRRMVKTAKHVEAASVGGQVKALNAQPNLGLVATDKEEDKESPDPQGTVVRQADVEEVWRITPTKSRQRSSKGEIQEALRASVNRGQTVDQVLAGLLGYFTSREATREDGRFMKGVHRVIAKDRFLAFTERAPVHQLAEADPWPGRLRRWVLTADWDDCAWGPPPGPGCRAPPDQVAAALEEAEAARSRRASAKAKPA